ncbi:MAG TPA: hypothetical protein PL033_15395 [Candidatus Brocadiia bacterium]|nr:hypothetical protein [Candidatus Brocadiia bacterium]
MDDLATFLAVPCLAVGLGWGIRGQFGHERGALVPGAFLGLSLALLSGWPVHAAIRLGAITMMTCAVGGLMTYGQTLGLVQNQPVSSIRWWGYLGLFVKGGFWFGFVGVFTGMMAGGVPYGAAELLVLMLVTTILGLVGMQLFNRPHQPPDRLPRIYFSGRASDKPRLEYWGGLWLGLLGVMAYAWFIKGDGAAVRLACWGILGGGIGFSFGEMLQCFGSHRVPFGQKAQPWIDWWKVMEITFGLFGGLFIAMGWVQTFGLRHPAPEFPITIPSRLELLGIVIWLPLAVIGHHSRDSICDLWELPFQALVIPIPCIFCGSVWPAFAIMPLLTLATARHIIWQEHYGRDKYIGRTTMFILIWGVFAVASLFGYQWWIGVAPLKTWFYCALVIQTGATVILAFCTRSALFPPPELKKKYGPLATFIAAGGQFPTTMVFVVMMLAIMALTTP